MADKNITARNEDKSVQTREETRASERYIKPSVNIIETENGLTLTADIPGAAKETVDINVDNGVLTINAPVSRSMCGQPVYTEFELAPYYRQFTIPEVLDLKKVKAEFECGILTLHLTKAEAAKPHKIAIKAA
ncbi:Hsp20/alpha crystallin family protein [Geobacter sp. SVR]|uniref:Hsp20/alpha crystallin family protein n=1 Tax=Geobacter sp. SVR TaxID=2495594 RepID=UPI00143F0159|nr:Hsp20/alpha crystallin family protein [Geobacter sp. SVR]BCS51886.1 molecular chaperone [Geobacter sp. SVR]GCF87730.1 molecular chaperone [Geobacter sp. SVR]